MTAEIKGEKESEQKDEKKGGYCSIMRGNADSAVLSVYIGKSILAMIYRPDGD